MAFFALTTAHGAGWDASLGIREQKGWDEPAAFMDGLVDDGFVVLGGPFADGERTMLVIDAGDENAVRARLAEDPWAKADLLRIAVIEPWTIWLDGTGRSS